MKVQRIVVPPRDRFSSRRLAREQLDSKSSWDNNRCSDDNSVILLIIKTMFRRTLYKSRMPFALMFIRTKKRWPTQLCCSPPNRATTWLLWH